MGDPECAWTVGAIPQFTVGITHPGFGDTQRNTKLDSCKDFTDITETDEKLTFTFKSHEVPAKGTSYIKYAFDISAMAAEQLPSFNNGDRGRRAECVDDDVAARADCKKVPGTEEWDCGCADLQQRGMCTDATYGAVVAGQ